jgi:hypothetical protein
VTASAKPEVDGCLCVDERDLDPRMDGSRMCRTELCTEREEPRCKCVFGLAAGTWCTVPMQKGKCPAGKEPTASDVVPKGEPCLAYRRLASVDYKEVGRQECSVCYSTIPHRGTPDEACYGYDHEGRLHDGKWRCGAAVVDAKPATRQCPPAAGNDVRF